MGIFERLFKKKLTKPQKKAKMSPDSVAVIGIMAHEMLRAGQIMIKVTNASEGRAAAQKVANIFHKLPGPVRFPDRVLDFSHLPDGEIVKHCHQLASGFLHQGKMFSKAFDQQVG